MIHRALATALLLLAVPVLTHAAEIHVGPGAGMDFAIIQDGVDASVSGDSVIVHPGVYSERVLVGSKAIVLTSIEPTSSAIVATTVIDGGGTTGPALVTFSSGATTDALLAGFTLRNGFAQNGGAVDGGQGRARIMNNVITNNGAWNGGAGLFYCHGLIQANTILNNITVARPDALGGVGGGLFFCDGAILDNVIDGNVAEDGGGLYGCDGLIRGNLIVNNTARGDFAHRGSGGGLYRCDGMIERNTVTNNTARWGGGLARSDGTIVGNTISNNTAVESGGGLSGADGAIKSNVITENDVGQAGGGLFDCLADLTNNTIAYNIGSTVGGGGSGCLGEIENCIVWGNAGVASGPQLDDASSTPTYSCIEAWTRGGEGNIVDDPVFRNVGLDDWRVDPLSPCVDGGYPFPEDFDACRPPGQGSVTNDIGAHGGVANCALLAPTGAPWLTIISPDADIVVSTGTTEITIEGTAQDAMGAIALVEFQFNGGPWTPVVGREAWAATIDDLPVGRTHVNIRARDDDNLWSDVVSRNIRRLDPAGDTIVVDISGGGDSTTIQAAIDAAENGFTVLVKPGVYSENLLMRGKDLTLTSDDPTSDAIVAATVVSGGFAGSALAFNGQETSACLVTGFTFTDGLADYGGGVRGGSESLRSLATLRGNVIGANSANIGGGGLAYCDGELDRNRILFNSAATGGGLYECDGFILTSVINGNAGQSGGGIALCDGLVEDNAITSNSCLLKGGGAYQCDGDMLGNWFYANRTFSNGGAIADCQGTIGSNVIESNVASDGFIGFGGGVFNCDGRLHNNLIVDNLAGGGFLGQGGGLYGCDGVIENNTIVDNAAGLEGGGVSTCLGLMRGDIIWGNDSPTTEVAQIDGASTAPLYSCVQDWSGGGEGVITDAPRFTDSVCGRYYLRSDSPCIDAGPTASALQDACLPPGQGGARNDMGFHGGPDNCANVGLPIHGLLPYLICGIGDGAGLDVNGDGLVDVADLIESINRLTIAP